MLSNYLYSKVFLYHFSDLRHDWSGNLHEQDLGFGSRRSLQSIECLLQLWMELHTWLVGLHRCHPICHRNLFVREKRLIRNELPVQSDEVIRTERTVQKANLRDKYEKT